MRDRKSVPYDSGACQSFAKLREAQALACRWKREYNEERPHSSLGYLTPAEFAVRPHQHMNDGLSLLLVREVAAGQLCEGRGGEGGPQLWYAEELRTSSHSS